MRKTLICAVTVATAAVPTAAMAKHKDKPDKDKPPAYCVPKNVGYSARGVLVSSELTQTAGADTTKRGDDRYSGNVVVDVAKANHKAPTGEQSFTLTDARAKFHPRNDMVVGAGDRVKLKGKVTTGGKKCADADPVVTVRKVDFKAKRTA